MFRYRVWQLILAVLFIFFSYTDIFQTKSSSHKYAGEVITSSIERFKQRTDSLYSKLRDTCHLIYPFNCPEVTELFDDNDITALRYENRTLVYWNSNSIAPRYNQLTEAGKIVFSRYKNGIYLCRGFKEDTISVYFLQPVYLNYNTTNSYLQDHFTSEFPVSNNFRLSLMKEEGSFEVPVSVSPSKVYLTQTSKLASTIESILRFGSLLIGFILLFQFILHYILSTSRILNPGIQASLYFILVIATHIFFNSYFIVPDVLKELLIFNPDYYASPYISDSLGTLFIEGIIQFLIVANYYASPRQDFKNKIIAELEFITSATIITIASSLLVITYKSLIMDSNIAFEFFNPYNPDFNNLINLSAVGILVITHFILCNKLYQSILAEHRKNHLIRLVVCLIISIAGSLIMFDDLFDSIIVFVLVLLPALSMLKTGKLTSYLSGISGIFLLLIGYAIIISYFVFHLSIEKDLSLRTAYANKLITERDNVTEYLLGEIRSTVLNDFMLQEFFLSDHQNARGIIDHLNNMYFNNGFNRFNVNYYFYDKGNRPISLEEDLTITNDELIGNSVVCGEHELYFLTEPAGSFTYIAEYPIREKDSIQGTLMVQLTSKLYKSANVYPELLLEEKNKLPISDYSYGIYTGNTLSEHSGKYNYPYSNDFNAFGTLKTDTLSDGEMSLSRHNGYNHLIYKRDANKVVVVSLEENQNARFLSYFTYLFIVLIFWTGLVWLFFNLKIVRLSDISLFRYSTASFRTFIQVSFFIIILTSVLLIGFYTGRFFIRQYNEQTEQKLFEKLDQVASLSNFMIYDQFGTQKIDIGYNTLNELLRNNIASISNIQKIDVNIYNLNGDLLTTSQPAIFEKGFISHKINPNAYSLLTHNVQNQLIQHEQIGGLQYLSGYKPIVLKNGELAAFIHLPYFNSTKYLNEQLGVFFATLISILVFALIAAGLLAPLISKHIARRLDVIAEQFKQVTLGKKNKPIEWHTKDEIGSLVEEFNKMIIKLEENALLLAKSERESAWREMAKQVAHEIKNPLTPMKLSIQHLQRAYQNNASNKEELADRVTKTLIEQIDTLTKIANEFSTFAQMPIGEIERTDLSGIIQSSYNLYKENESADFSIQLPEFPVFVMADKNQLLRVFNNLILNALQAIPEDKTGNIKVNLIDSGTSVIVSVSDNGVGIKPEEATRLFTPNFTTKNSGSGLGLAISKNIIESFGGKIYFKSQEGMGTTFYVELPKVK
jgi:signal transduction histidine kinase